MALDDSERSVQASQDIRHEQDRLAQVAEVGVWSRARRVAGARFGVGQNRGDHRLHVAPDARAIIQEYGGNAADVRRAGIAGDQVLNQLFANEWRNGLLGHQGVQHGLEILRRSLSGGNGLRLR